MLLKRNSGAPTLVLPGVVGWSTRRLNSPITIKLALEHPKNESLNMKLKKLIAACALSLSSAWAFAQPTLALTAGSGTDADIYGVSLITNTGFYKTEFGNNWLVNTHIETTVSNVEGKNSGANKGVVIAGVTPVIRFVPKRSPGYFEAGIGLNFFSEKDINAQKRVGTHFEFGDFIGFGFAIGARQQVEIGYRFLHYSNAGISKHNPGLDFHQVRLSYSF